MLKDRKTDFAADRIKRKQYFNMKHSHFHPYYEIYYLCFGKRKFFVNDTLYTLSKGDILILNKNILHRTTYISDETHERFSLIFTDKYLTPLINEYSSDLIMSLFNIPHMSIHLNRQGYLEDLLQKIVNEAGNTDEFSAHLLNGYFQELIIFLLRYQKAFTSDKITDSYISTSDKIIQDTAKYIRNSFDKTITLRDASEYANMSTTYFSKKFKRITGFGFKEYLCNVRLTEAAKRLLETNDSVTKIALDCGFNDSNYFGDVFKKEKGISPLQYRKAQGFV